MCGVIPTKCSNPDCDFYVIIGPCPRCGGRKQ
jgi:hypothetical protein